ncbi:DUF4097 family beta strand repeat-containing protein [Streptomyces sp. NPDC004539]|uniref:DUF4097 family beta strand repeat-containing protein n=1 Tax=Streptomyces sp. NPDC004539 TaxID=3154280 RepID=UPI0033A8F4A9
MQKFATPARITAVLTLPAGRVQLIAADRADTTVEIRPADPTKSRDVKTAEQTTAVYDAGAGVLRIEGPAPKSQLLGGQGAVEITVQLPAGSHVEAGAGAAEFRGVGRFGDVTFEGGYREVKLDEATSARLSSHDGDITVGRLTGPAELSTQRGTIRIAEAVRGALTLTTQQGDIEVAVAHGTSASLDAGTTYGRVSNSLKNDGTSTLTITATTAQGDITARSL